MNKTDKHIAFLLGAGFSVPAGLPTANMLSKSVVSEIYDKIRMLFKDGNGDWKEMLKCFILEKVLLDHDECYAKFNYEQYFDFLSNEKKKTLDTDKLLSFIERGMYGYCWRCCKENDQERGAHVSQIQDMLEYTTTNCVNYSEIVEGVRENYQSFVAYNVAGNAKNGKVNRFNTYYKHFVNILSYYVDHGYIVDIYTLNHDLFLESLLSFTILKDVLSNGFGGEVLQICNKEYKVFDTKFFNNTIRIYKLHGSIDIYELSFADKPNKQYIQVLDGYSVNHAFLMDQTRFASMLPLFITGKLSKEKQYDNEPYNSMLNEMRNNIGDAEKLIVVGYSGNDDGINGILDECFFKWNNTYVISPSADNHPFVKDKKAIAINKGVESLSCGDVEIY